MVKQLTRLCTRLLSAHAHSRPGAQSALQVRAALPFIEDNTSPPGGRLVEMVSYVVVSGGGGVIIDPGCVVTVYVH